MVLLKYILLYLSCAHRDIACDITQLVSISTCLSMLLEFCPTIISLILAGKVGSNIASELGSMRVTEQIDALEVMGVNSIGYLVGPKILAALFIFPIVI